MTDTRAAMDDMRDPEVASAMRAEEAAAAATPGDEISQHIGWLKQYVEGMTAANWQDMRLRADRQLAQLSKDLDARDVAQAAPNCDPVEVRLLDGAIDEIIIRRSDVHIEQMSAGGWFMGVDACDGSHHHFWFGATNGKSHVEFRHTETTPPSMVSMGGKK